MTKLNLQKKLAAKVARVGTGRVKISPDAREEVKGAITKTDIQNLIKEGAISIKKLKTTSRHRARKRHEQRKKGRQRGHGKRKGTKKARTPKKRVWINKIRTQRNTLRMLKDKDKLKDGAYRRLYLKAKGGFFRSKKHLLLYAEKNKMIK